MRSYCVLRFMSGLLLIQFHQIHGAAALGGPGSGHPQDGPPQPEGGWDTAQVEVTVQSCKAGPTVHSPVWGVSSGAAGDQGNMSISEPQELQQDQRYLNRPVPRELSREQEHVSKSSFQELSREQG